MKICVDTTILIDILKDEFRNSQELLYSALAAKETLVAPVVVFAELLPQFKGNTEQVKAFLGDHAIRIESLELDSVILAGERWMKYLKRTTRSACPHCGQPWSGKDHFLSDFSIGGFALAECDTIITRDRGIYKRYFPELKMYR